MNVELIDHGSPLDTRDNDLLAAMAAERRLPVLASNNVHYAVPQREQLAAAVAAVRSNRGLDELDGWLPAHAGAHLRSGAEMRERFARYPGAVERTVTLADELAFPLRRAKPALPKQKVPPGHTPMSWLRHLVWEAVPRKYPDLTEEDRARIEKELGVIELKDFPGYFLIVYGIVQEARRRGILCQGRGSAANSAICFLLDITAVDSIAYKLPFERFLSSLRDEEPDIDVDFDSDRREEIIQWVYATYGRERAAQVANVIQYRPKNAVRDMAKALGHSPGQQDAWSKQVEQWGATLSTGPEHDIPDQVIEYASELLKAPRHLGIHSGGMVLTDRPVGEVVPIEHARMENRTVIQWDKDDAAWMGLVKFDLLGLGMLAALQYCFDLIDEATGEQWELATIPKEEKAVYDMLCRADSIGVFQVESRAQMGLLPRLQPRRFYDLVIEIALIRPGPIQGGAVHPFVRRKLGYEEVTYPHPKLEPVLERTLGIPVFQEQLMQMAMAVGECTGEDADLLRRAMGSKRGIEQIESLKEKLYAGMATNGLVGQAADDIYARIQAFANFGFAESHSLSFGLLVYASSWIKLHYPAAFLAGLLRAQPMGFYSPATLTADARRHGVEVRRPDLLLSGAEATLEPVDSAAEDDSRSLSEPKARRNATGLDSCTHRTQPPVGDFDRNEPDESAAHRRDGRLRRAPGPRRGQGHRRHRRRAHRRRARERRRVPRPARPGAPRRGHAGAARGARDRRGVRVPRAQPPRGDLARRVGRAGSRRVPPRLAGVRAAAAVHRSDELRAARERPVGDGHLHRRPPDDPLPVGARRARSAHLEGAARSRVRAPRRGRGTRDPPATAGDGIRNHVLEPRGRARPRQRHLLGRGVEQVSPRRPRRARSDRARDAGALGRGSDEPRRRPVRRPAGRSRPSLPRLPVSQASVRPETSRRRNAAATNSRPV